MSLLPCPKWVTDDPSKLPVIAQAASAIYDFFTRQNPKGYILGYGDLKEWHRKLFTKVVPVPYYAGNFRGTDKAKPCLDTPIYVANIPGAAAKDVEAEMKAFSEQLDKAIRNTDEYVAKNISSIAKLQAAAQLAAYAGGSVIKIHPFINGNGRVARLTMNFILHRYLGKTPFFIDRPSHPDYSTASALVMRDGNYVPLYQYLVEILAFS